MEELTDWNAEDEQIWREFGEPDSLTELCGDFDPDWGFEAERDKEEFEIQRAERNYERYLDRMGSGY